MWSFRMMLKIWREHVNHEEVSRLKILGHTKERMLGIYVTHKCQRKLVWQNKKWER